jgi:hypothetical protein
MTKPPLGAKCSDCGCCDADIAVGDGSAICWECDAGEQCNADDAPKTLEPAASPGSNLM